MVDKEKTKVRKAKEAATGGDVAEGDDDMTPAGPATPTTVSKGKGKVRKSRAKTPPFNLAADIGHLADSLLAQKRAATDEATPTGSAKKPRAPRKSKKTVTAEADDDEPAEEEDEAVNAEVFE